MYCTAVQCTQLIAQPHSQGQGHSQFSFSMCARQLPTTYLCLHYAKHVSLARGLICAFLGADTEVPSPTFTLVQRYQPELDEQPSAPELLHFDLYRLEGPEDIWELGWEELDEVISLVEWPDKAGPHLSPRHLDIEIISVGDHRRAHLSASPTSNWKSRLHDF